MDKLKDMLSFLNGKKTYLGAVGFFLVAVYQTLQGDYVHAGEAFMAALTAVGIRHAVEKAAPDAKDGV